MKIEDEIAQALIGKQLRKGAHNRQELGLPLLGRQVEDAGKPSQPDRLNNHNTDPDQVGFGTLRHLRAPAKSFEWELHPFMADTRLYRHIEAGIAWSQF
jgi:hypothetical protein